LVTRGLMYNMSYPIADISEKIREEGHTGRLRRYVQRKYGAEGFTEDGKRIKLSVITHIIDTAKPNSRLHKEAVLARTYHNISVGKKTFRV
jgi:hypothetical protein